MSQSPIPPPFPQRPLEYQSLRTVQPLDYSPGRRFFMGLLLGTGVSALLWIPGLPALFKSTGDTIFTLAFALLGLKFVAFIVCMFLARWRTFGVGLFVSMVTGVMIFFGVCVALISMGK